MSSQLFNAPANSQWRAKDHNGKLHIITAVEYLPLVNTVNGDTDAVDGKVVVVNEESPADSEVFEGARIFGGGLIAATKPFIGKGMVLGRLGQAAATPGKNPAWILLDPTEADREKAQAYLNSTAPQI